MAHAYCTGCSARVSVVDGRCLLDHRIDITTISEGAGRRSRGRGSRLAHPRSSAHLAERVDTDEPAPPSVARRLERFALDLTAGVRSDQSRSDQAQPDHARVAQPVARNILSNSADPAPAQIDLREGGGVATLEHPRVALPRVAHVLAPTNDLIDQMWTAGSKAEPIDGWTIGEMDTESTVMARRVFLGTLMTVGVAFVVAVMWFMAGRGDASVESTVAHIEASEATLLTSLSTSDSAISDLRDGVLDDRDGAAASATAIDSAARDLFARGANLPATGEWADLRTEAVATSDRAIAYARLMSRTTSYVSTVEVMFNRPDYPVTVADADLGEVAEMTATWVTRFIATSTSLPTIEGLEDHRLAVIALAEFLPQWQSTYLDALRSGNVAIAGDAVGDLHARVIQLSDDLTLGMTAVADELVSEQAMLAQAIGS